MSEIAWKLEPTDIEWEMDWSATDKDGKRKYPDQPEKEMIFESDRAVAHLLINEVLHLNSHHWEKQWPEGARKATALLVNCNDIFAWGCAESEEITMEGDAIQILYRMWQANPAWGPALWCMVQRREMPQTPVADAMRAAGVDLDSFQEEHNLRVNFYSGFGMALAQFKYHTYADWARAQGNDPLPFDKHWWAGWNDFTMAHPDWQERVGNAEARIRAEFIQANGWEGDASLAEVSP